MTIEPLHEILADNNLRTLKLIGVNILPDNTIAQINTMYAVCVMDFMDYCGVRGSMTSNWHKLLRTEVGTLYDDKIKSVVDMSAEWVSEHTCTRIDHYTGKVITSIHGTVKVIPVEHACNMGCHIGNDRSKIRFRRTLSKLGIQY